MVLLGGIAGSILNFRSELVSNIVAQGHVIYTLAPDFSEKQETKVRELGGIPVKAGFARVSLNPFLEIANLYHLYKTLREIRPEIFVGYTVKPATLGVIVAKLARVPRTFPMITGLGYAFVGQSFKQLLVSKVVKSLYRISIAVSNKVFFQNKDDCALFNQLGIANPRNSVIINGSGVNLRHFAELPPSVTPFRFLLVARLYREKGIFEFIEAARKVKSVYPEARFLVVGSPDIGPTGIPSKLVESWISEGLIEYHGWVEDVRPFYSMATVFVLPSYREGVPRSVLEAMASGRPIITTDAPGCRETVVPFKNGWLVRPGDVESLSEAMFLCLRNCEATVKYGRASREIAEKRFDVQKVNKVIIEEIGLKPKVEIK